MFQLNPSLPNSPLIPAAATAAPVPSTVARGSRNTDNYFLEHICTSCDKTFPTPTGLEQHYLQSPEHHYCHRCSTHFDASDVLFFRNEFGLHEHHRQSVRHRDQYCAPCKQLFGIANELASHLNSSLHRSETQLSLTTGCTRISGAADWKIPGYVHEYDDRPSQVTAHAGIREATEHAWNGGVYECFLCYTGYRTLAALQQHFPRKCLVWGAVPADTKGVPDS
ncbi:hypothetical protein MSAN_01609300 [Mycena sanguinolenta]|uniref:C2H2-type domain-containing protein n=1 Tax=Mycena sanguinolenta TaxID=230812 RepID=A0A8H7CVF5_9AGAR|nr:hypothetical protein MSAN_01609300 [Mycena sanguinolenta]